MAATVVERIARPLAARIRQTIADQQLFHRHDRVVVGVSGGADSVALLQLLVELQPSLALTLYIAHLDHQLRPESVEDAAFVQRLAEQCRLPFILERRDVRRRCQEEGWSLEDGARRIRYQCFHEAAVRYSADAVALAHTADDQAETVLLRLLRGSGVTGLGAMAPTRPFENLRLVRPLLQVWRHELIEYLSQRQVSYREDSSNQDIRFSRNRIRHELLPLLARDYNPNIKMLLTQLAEHSQAEAAFLEAAVQRLWKRLAKSTTASEVSLDLGAMARQPLALQRQLVRQAIRRVRGDLNQFEYRHWLEIEQLMRARPVGAIVDLPGGIQVSRDARRLIIRLAARHPHTDIPD